RAVARPGRAARQSLVRLAAARVRAAEHRAARHSRPLDAHRRTADAGGAADDRRHARALSAALAGAALDRARELHAPDRGHRALAAAARALHAAALAGAHRSRRRAHARGVLFPARAGAGAADPLRQLAALDRHRADGARSDRKGRGADVRRRRRRAPEPGAALGRALGDARGGGTGIPAPVRALRRADADAAVRVEPDHARTTRVSMRATVQAGRAASYNRVMMRALVLSRYVVLLACAAWVSLAAAQAPSTHQHGFRDAERWARVFDDPKRDAWQMPAEVIRALELEPD